MTDKLEKITAYILLCITIASLLPVMYLGRYNHPTGDDYYYGAETRAVWEETGNIAETVAEAARRTAVQYRIWQGTYSALFLMHLPPNIFSEGVPFCDVRNPAVAFRGDILPAETYNPYLYEGDGFSMDNGLFPADAYVRADGGFPGGILFLV